MAFTGKDVMALGYKGRQIGVALSILLELVLNCEIENDKELLLRALESKKEEILRVKP